MSILTYLTNMKNLFRETSSTELSSPEEWEHWECFVE